MSTPVKSTNGSLSAQGCIPKPIHYRRIFFTVLGSILLGLGLGKVFRWLVYRDPVSIELPVERDFASSEYFVVLRHHLGGRFREIQGLPVTLDIWVLDWNYRNFCSSHLQDHPRLLEKPVG